MIAITVIVKIYYNISSLPKMYIAVIGKKRFQVGKTDLVCEASLRYHTFC